jgi:hypothetical protein
VPPPARDPGCPSSSHGACELAARVRPVCSSISARANCSASNNGGPQRLAGRSAHRDRAPAIARATRLALRRLREHRPVTRPPCRTPGPGGPRSGPWCVDHHQCVSCGLEDLLADHASDLGSSSIRLPWVWRRPAVSRSPRPRLAPGRRRRRPPLGVAALGSPDDLGAGAISPLGELVDRRSPVGVSAATITSGRAPSADARRSFRSSSSCQCR